MIQSTIFVQSYGMLVLLLVDFQAHYLEESCVHWKVCAGLVSQQHQFHLKYPYICCWSETSFCTNRSKTVQQLLFYQDFGLFLANAVTLKLQNLFEFGDVDFHENVLLTDRSYLRKRNNYKLKADQAI